jgi:succinate dehydrogenase/fumarate reductase flavoprotein subunit
LTTLAQDLAALPRSTLGDVVAASEIEDMCRVGAACAASALLREESRAAHYREDFPDIEANWMCNVLYGPRGATIQPIAWDPQEFGASRRTGPADPTASRPGAKEFVE